MSEQPVLVKMRPHPTSPGNYYPACDTCAGTTVGAGTVNLPCWHCGYMMSRETLFAAMNIKRDDDELGRDL
jgi:tRNA(Ile2) C34 agmatinyltransferase TiaS